MTDQNALSVFMKTYPNRKDFIPSSKEYKSHADEKGYFVEWKFVSIEYTTMLQFFTLMKARNVELNVLVEVINKCDKDEAQKLFHHFVSTYLAIARDGTSNFMIGLSENYGKIDPSHYARMFKFKYGESNRYIEVLEESLFDDEETELAAIADSLQINFPAIIPDDEDFGFRINAWFDYVAKRDFARSLDESLNGNSAKQNTIKV